MTLQELIDANPDAQTFRFGDSDTLCREILALIRAGKKEMSCEALRHFTEGDDVLPEVGRRDIALNWDGTPAMMIETVEVLTMRFDEMTEDLVAAQGEFRDLEHWRKVYRAYFTCNGGWSEDMMILCERYRMIEDYA